MPRTSALIALLACTFPALAAAVDRAASPLLPDGAASEGVQRLRLDAAAYAELEGLRAVRLEGFPLPGLAAPVALHLERFDVLTPAATLLTASGDAQAPLIRPDAQLWRGTVAGVEGSYVYLGLSPSGIAGYVGVGDARYILSSGPAGTLPPVIYDLAGPAARRLNIQTPSCAGALPVPGLPAGDADHGPGGYGDRADTCRAYTIALECDEEFTGLFGGDTDASGAYALFLLGAVSELYQREMSVTLNVDYLRLWTAGDPYVANDTLNRLFEFRDLWNATQGETPRSLAHFLSGGALGGGIAYLEVVCNPFYGYGLSANLNGSFPYPVVDHSHQNWDLMVVSHELGHNLGSGHTHDSYDPPIDGCGNPYLNPPLPQDCSNAYEVGSIMSYCHLCPGGLSNMAMEFGPRVAERITGYLADNAFCGTASEPPSFVQHPVGATVAPGTSIDLAVEVAGDAPAYQWLRDSVLLSETPPYSGTGTPVLTITGATAAVAGSYTAVAYNDCATVESDPALLTVGSPCGSTDFDGDGDEGTDADIEAFFSVLSGGVCPTGTCGTTDFDGDGDEATDSDIEALFRAIAGGPC